MASQGLVILIVLVCGLAILSACSTPSTPSAPTYPDTPPSELPSVPSADSGVIIVKYDHKGGMLATVITVTSEGVMNFVRTSYDGSDLVDNATGQLAERDFDEIKRRISAPDFLNLPPKLESNAQCFEAEDTVLETNVSGVLKKIEVGCVTRGTYQPYDHTVDQLFISLKTFYTLN